MPSRNSVNKPKDKILKSSHAAALGKRRSSRLQSTTRSATGRYNESAAPKPTESSSIALYTGKIPVTNSITNRTISNKKSKKLARNKKYNEKRNELLRKDVDAIMQVDKEPKKTTDGERLSNKLWEVIKSKDLSTFKSSSASEPTIVGVQSF